MTLIQEITHIEVMELQYEDDDEPRYHVSGQGHADGLYDEVETEPGELLEAEAMAEEWRDEAERVLGFKVAIVWR